VELLLLPVWKYGCIIFCPVSHIRPLTSGPAPSMINTQWKLRTASICLKMLHLQCYLVATVMHVHSLRSPIFVCIDIFFAILGQWSGKRIKRKNWHTGEWRERRKYFGGTYIRQPCTKRPYTLGIYFPWPKLYASPKCTICTIDMPQRSEFACCPVEYFMTIIRKWKSDDEISGRIRLKTGKVTPATASGTVSVQM